MDTDCRLFIYVTSSTVNSLTVDEVNARTAKARIAFGRLRGNIWDRSGIGLNTKLKVYKAAVLPTLMYACETWTVYQGQAKRRPVLHKLSEKTPKGQVARQDPRYRSPKERIPTLLKLAQLKDRPCDERLPKRAFCGEFQMGKCSLFTIMISHQILSLK